LFGYNMSITKEKWKALREQMEKLSIQEEDLREKFILGSGSGGQKLNKTSSCVYLKHLPSNIEVKCQQERSREVNRFLARQELCNQVAEKIYQEETKRKKATFPSIKTKNPRRKKETF
jgi:protein subunit release factor B